MCQELSTGLEIKKMRISCASVNFISELDRKLHTGIGDTVRQSQDWRCPGEPKGKVD